MECDFIVLIKILIKVNKMRKVRVLKKPTFEIAKNNIRTARKCYTIFLFNQDYVYIFKNKKIMTAFITDFQKEINVFILMLNQIIADLFSIYMQNWAICQGNNIAEMFFSIDKRLSVLSWDEVSFYDSVNNMSKLINNVHFIINVLKKLAQTNKNYVLSRYLGALEAHVNKLADSLFNFGRSGKWAAYGEKYNPKKLY